ncbi:MAG: two pore domain potassium channel family protein, partial [Holophaga sp.]|nr:two pore domain potassium channel family protein [Holophaga sp.]
SMAIIIGINLMAFLVLLSEHTTNSTQFGNFGDAVWWTVATISTVGYGDLVPRTMTGRMVGIVPGPPKPAGHMGKVETKDLLPEPKGLLPEPEGHAERYLPPEMVKILDDKNGAPRSSTSSTSTSSTSTSSSSSSTSQPNPGVPPGGI